MTEPSNAAKATLVARWELPARVAVDRAALGETTATVIGGHRCRVVMPQLMADNDEELSPPARIPSHDDDEFDWGWPLDGPRHPEGGFAVLGLGVEFDKSVAATAAFKKNLPRQLRNWFASVRDWVEIVSEQDLDDGAPLKSMDLVSRGVKLWDGGEPLKMPIRVRFGASYGSPVSASQWKRVLRLAATGTRPEVEWLLLRDARAAARRGQLRRSVIDAGTALEVALGKILLAKHRDNPTPLTDALMEGSDKWMLSRSLEVAKRVESLPPSVNGGVVTLRNKTVHRSVYEPTAKEASDAVKAALDAITLVNPLPPELTSS